MNANYCFLTRRFRANRHNYTLKMYETDSTDIGYKLTRNGKVMFQGRHYRPGAGIAHDSNDSVKGLMGFLTLRPGDTDREYFDSYTPDQMGFALMEAEDLRRVIAERYGD